MRSIAWTTVLGLSSLLPMLAAVDQVSAQVPEAGTTDSTAEPLLIAQGSESSERDIEALEERLRLLEQQQQQLLDELKSLKQQLSETEAVTGAGGEAQTVVEAETPATDIDAASLEPQPIAVESSDRPQGLYLSGEALFLQPNPSDELDFAIADPGEALAVSGDIETVDYNLSTNTRIGVGYRKEDIDVRATWLSIESGGRASSQRPAGGFLFSTITSPAQNDSAETASTQIDLDYTTTDLEVGYALQAGRNVDIRLAAGLRFADTDHSMRVQYDGVDFTNATADFDYDFSGFGPKLGLDARWKLGAGFSAFGRATGALLMGDARSVYRETDNNGVDLVADLTQRNNDKIIPVAEMALGLNWTRQVTDNVALAMSAGYEYQNWFNAYSEPQLVDDSSPGLFSSNDVDMSFQGFFFRTGLSLDF